MWEITNACNAHCKHCCTNAKLKKKSNELSTKKIIEIIKDLKNNNVTHILFTGGEFFLKDGFMDILKAATGLIKTVTISSNGSLINKKIANHHILKKTKFIIISLDSVHPEKYDNFRELKGLWKRAVNSLILLNEAGVDIKVAMTLTTLNYGELEDMIKFCISKNFPVLIVFMFLPIGRGSVNQQFLLSSKQEIEAKKKIIEFQKKYKNKIVIKGPRLTSLDAPLQKCPGGEQYFYINSLGQVGPCAIVCHIKNSFLTNETLKNKSFLELSNSPQIKKFRGIIKKNFNNPICRKCVHESDCGRGCPFAAWLRYKNINEIDPQCPYKE
jgi:radical SAM protein with 4Fe4S-binding SPASM domain